MDEDGDDLYGAAVTSNGASQAHESSYQGATANVVKEESVPETKPAVDDEDDSDDSDDSSIDIVVEAKEGAEAPPRQQSAFQRAKGEPVRISTDTGASATLKRERDSVPPRPDSAAPVKKITVKDGSKMPEVRTSNIELEQDPIYGATGKPITEIDLDADIAMETKPWRVAGTDPTDFFNYGFDEFTWVQYCLKQKTMRESVQGLRQESKQFEAMLGGPPAPAMPQQPGMAGMSGMPGMGDMPPEMMNAMFAQMQAQGVNDPSQLDFNSVMQNMGMMGMMPGMPGQQQSQQGFGQQGGATPQPPQPQGYGQPEDFTGFSEQQINMYKQQQQGGFGNRRGRGRGRY